MKEKIKSQKAIIAIARRLKRRGKKTVIATGSFDILHRGHLNMLSEAKRQGDVLIVLINTDKSVRGYKGGLRPVFRENDRALLLTALECVDYVVLFSQPSPISIIKQVRPDVYCNGLDWERKAAKGYCGRNHVIRRTAGVSTTDIVEKIIRLYCSGGKAPKGRTEALAE